MKDPSITKRVPGIIAASTLISTALITVASAHEPGRMTGGGSIVCSNGGFRVTHGFELHCIDDGEQAAALPNNLEVNWSDPTSGVEQNFHLTLLGTAVCSDSPQIDEKPPDAGFDTMVATGTGTLNNVPGAFISFTFTDAGEPGAGADRATYTITTGTSDVVLHCEGAVLSQGGNHQAHKLTGND